MEAAAAIFVASVVGCRRHPAVSRQGVSPAKSGIGYEHIFHELVVPSRAQVGRLWTKGHKKVFSNTSAQ